MKRSQPAKQLILIGVGMIGSSIALSARQHHQFNYILGCDNDKKVLADCKQAGIIDDALYSEDKASLLAHLAELSKEDMIMIATPPATIHPYLTTCLNSHTPALITDVLSVKTHVTDCVLQYDKKHATSSGHVVPAHPIAGSEGSGYQAANPSLLVGKTVILTPLNHTDPYYLKRCQQFWQQLGATTHVMASDVHDKIFAYASHLPHMLAYSLMLTLANTHCNNENALMYSASGFKDFLRLSRSNSVMWRDICLTNPKALAASIHQFEKHIQKLKNAINAADDQYLYTFFEKARKTSEKINKQ